MEHIEQNYTLEQKEGYRVIKGMNRQGLYKLFAKLGYKIGAEVGLEKGKNAIEMFENIPDLKLYGVDPYKQHKFAFYVYDAEIRHWNQNYLNGCMYQALKRLKGQNFELLKDFSEDAVKDIPDGSLDFVYIDGDHSYDMAMHDVIMWGRKVRKGGIVSGHDFFYDKSKPGRRAKVTQAIKDYTSIHGIKFFITDEDHYEKKGDFYPSWLWVKSDMIWPNIVGF